MRDKKIILVLQGIKLGLDTIEIIKIDFRQHRIEILNLKVQEEIKKIQNRKTILKFVKLKLKNHFKIKQNQDSN